MDKLCAAKEDVEKKFLKTKWSQIAKTLEKRGGKLYSPKLIQAEISKMERARASDCKEAREAVLEAVLDVDEKADKATGEHLDEAMDEDGNEGSL